jgi:uncharacterized YigZ family protein
MSFLTLAKNGSGLYKEKGSKFLGFAYRVKDEQEVKTLVDGLRKEHPGACHVCSAFKLGFDGKLYRASDDGEPNNSAGQPILGQINAFGVTQVLVAVVRYYGGTKLGVGGLIQAYRAAAKEALEDAGTIEEEIRTAFRVHCTYEQLPILMKAIKMQQVQIDSQQLDLQCELSISLNDQKVASWLDFLNFQGFEYVLAD